MTESIWHKEECGPGRHYMLGGDPYVKYDDQETITASIVEGLRKFIHAEPAVRLTLDSPKCDSERANLAIPFESDHEIILNNFAKMIYQSLIGYYISAPTKTSHFGITNLLLEGEHNSLLRREMEKLISQFQTRNDMAGRLLQNITLVGKHAVPKPGDTYLMETIKQGLDIHVGYRIFSTGENVNCSQIFLPIQAGSEIIDQIYYNIERILHHSFVAYDETGDGYLKVTDNLIFKDLAQLLQRAKTKELTRNKILNNLQFDTVTKRDVEEAPKMLLGDRLYDVLNHIQDTKLKEATDRSRDLYTACLHSTAELAQGRLTRTEAKIEIEAPEPSIEAKEAPTVQATPGMPPAETHQADAAPARPFKRRAPGGGDASKRRKFQKVELTQDELAAGSVQVPEPPKERTRVPSPKRARRITRIRPNEVGTPAKK
jgi:hypothetical protein